MSDVFDREKRRRIMSRIRARDTSPERKVRRSLYGMCYRYRLNVAGLPGKPDIVLRSRRRIVFVHGCFWHGHKGCRRSKRPASNVGFWDAKLDRTLERDRQAMRSLEDTGWKVLIVWECQTKDEAGLRGILSGFLEGV